MSTETAADWVTLACSNKLSGIRILCLMDCLWFYGLFMPVRPVAYERDFGDFRLSSRLALNIQVTVYHQQKNTCSQICLTNHLSDVTLHFLFAFWWQRIDWFWKLFWTSCSSVYETVFFLLLFLNHHFLPLVSFQISLYFSDAPVDN